jgi:hypothetical protein
MIDLKNIFNEFIDECDTYQTSGNVSAKLNFYPCVSINDQEPVSIIEPDFEQGPWIAGGAALRWYQRLPVGESDIDVFCKDSRQAQSVIDKIKSYNRFNVKHESDNAITIEYHRKDDWATSWTIQIITRRYFSSLREVIDNFDITVCQIGTCGREWLTAPPTARDIREHNLRFTGKLHPTSVKRLTKYWVYGFRPVEGTLENLVLDANVKWKFDDIGDYDNAF